MCLKIGRRILYKKNSKMMILRGFSLSNTIFNKRDVYLHKCDILIG